MISSFSLQEDAKNKENEFPHDYYMHKVLNQMYYTYVRSMYVCAQTRELNKIWYAGVEGFLKLSKVMYSIFNSIGVDILK